jgi:hypothetical protein
MIYKHQQRDSNRVQPVLSATQMLRYTRPVQASLTCQHSLRLTTPAQAMQLRCLPMALGTTVMMDLNRVVWVSQQLHLEHLQT